MATVTLESLIDDIEARIVAQVVGVQILDRLDPPREHPAARAHQGVRVWPRATSVIDEYAETDLMRVSDEIVIESVHRVSRSADGSLDAALSFERALRNAITNEIWYDNRDGMAATGDRVEVHFESASREKVEGWLIIEQIYRFHRDATLGGSIP